MSYGSVRSGRVAWVRFKCFEGCITDGGVEAETCVRGYGDGEGVWQCRGEDMVTLMWWGVGDMGWAQVAVAWGRCGGRRG